LPEFTIGYVGCTKGAWGKKIVQRVNEIVAGKRPPWIDAEARWLDPAAARRYEDVFARRSPLKAIPGKPACTCFRHGIACVRSAPA
jgi:hypothetical protein